MQFVTAQGSSGADTIIAGAANQVLTGNGGDDTLAGYAGEGDIFRDTAADLNGSIICNFAAKRQYRSDKFRRGLCARQLRGSARIAAAESSWFHSA